MVINITQTQVHNVFTVIFDTELSSREKIFVDAYGEPQIDSGGTFTYYPSSITNIPSQTSPYTVNTPLPNPNNGTNTAPFTEAFVLPSRLAYIRSSTPIQISFNANLDPDAYRKSQCWLQTIKTKLITAQQALLANQMPNTPNITVIEV
jgi:hypothetical protein